ncbi:MAG: hypothetical protein NTV05_12270 [Acidobacteria bacterium]|nr:hypothetical protein [Acidobacteriota bacterium]
MRHARVYGRWARVAARQAVHGGTAMACPGLAQPKLTRGLGTLPAFAAKRLRRGIPP